MPRHGYVPWWAPGKRPTDPETGAKACKMCPNTVGARRREYCSEECREDYLVRTSGSYARAKVERRDKGVCAICSTDTATLEKKLNEAALVDWEANESHRGRWFHVSWVYGRNSSAIGPGEKRVRDEMRGRGFRPGVALWEMDHITPVIEGGGGCGLDNLRTLCVPCHRQVTKDLARRRRKQRPLFGSEAR